MSIAIAIFCFSAWGAGVVVSAIYEWTTGTFGALNALTQFDIVRFEEQQFLFWSVRMPSPNGAWFSAIGQLALWNEAVWAGWANYIRVIFLLALAFGLVLALIMWLFGAFIGRVTSPR